MTSTPNRRCFILTTLALCIALALTSCSSTPERERHDAATASTSLGDEIALRAIAQVGKPYRYGGADLKGFDCSGLVFFIHRDLGFTVPRTAVEQYKASQPISIRKLIPGDLVFFRTTSRRAVSHVGIYAGEGRFIHAPQTGRLIEFRALDDAYYGPRIVGAGRLHASG
ncbi:MAG TPA: C40 family peptidase [Steroidobacteraceae bacterium]|nr:C40 family peptidase [Steroidobacteraceae bacterium]